jgi:predicted ATPase
LLYRFSDYELDAARRTLARAGRPVPIEPRPLELLLCLVEQRSRVVTTDELVSRIWPEVRVAAGSLPRCVWGARRAIGDDSEHQALIRTVRGRGYTFVAPVSVLVDPSRDAETSVGRRAELARAEALLHECAQGRGGTLLLSGEPGIGKTDTLKRITARAERSGLRVCLGRCREEQGAPAFWPWMQIVRPLVETFGDAALRRWLGPGGDDLGALVPGLHAQGEAQHGLAIGDSIQARFRLFDSAVRLIEHAARERPLLIGLDDLHRADATSLQLLDFLCTEIAELPLLVVGTYRDVQLARDGPRAALVAELLRKPTTSCLELPGLSLSDVTELVEARARSAATDAQIEALHALTGGNPFFLTQLLPLLEDGSFGGGAEPRSWAERLPSASKDAVAQQLDALSPECRDLLACASVIGRELSVRLLTSVASQAPPTVVAALDEASAARILAPDLETSETRRFAHALVREVLYDRLDPVRRSQLHLRVAQALESLHAGELEPHLSEIAHHLRCALPFGDERHARAYLVRAARWARSRLAYEEAIEHYTQALGLVHGDSAALARERCDLLTERGGAEMHIGLRDAARASLRRAAELAERLEDPLRLARVALAVTPSFTVVQTAVRDPVLVELLEKASERLGASEPALRARLLARLGFALRWDAPERYKELLARATSIADRVGDARARLETRSLRMLHNRGSEDHGQGEAPLIDAVASLAAELGDADVVLLAQAARIGVLLQHGDGIGAEREIGRYTQLAEELRHPQARWYAEMFVALRLQMAGRFVEAEQRARSYLTIGKRFQDANAMASFGSMLALIRLEQGRAHEMLPALEEMLRRYPTVPSWRAGLAMLSAAAGLARDARRELDLLAADGLDALCNGPVADCAMVILADVCDLIGDDRHAELIRERLLPYAGQMSIVGWGALCWGSMARALGWLAYRTGRWKESEDQFEAALALESKAGAEAWLAHTRFAFARMLCARRLPGDAEKARTLFRDARDAATELGMPFLARRMEAWSQSDDGRANLPVLEVEG